MPLSGINATMLDVPADRIHLGSIRWKFVSRVGSTNGNSYAEHIQSNLLQGERTPPADKHIASGGKEGDSRDVQKVSSIVKSLISLFSQFYHGDEAPDKGYYCIYCDAPAQIQS